MCVCVCSRMAESSTSPTLSRSAHKLEYTSCIATTTPSPSVITAYHSSFDFISEPRDCDTLVMTNQNNVPQRSQILARDLRRLDIDSNQRRMPSKSHKLDRTESISLPTTPTEKISPTFEYKYPLLLSLKNQMNNEGDDGQIGSRRSTLDYITTTSEQDSIDDESMSISKK